MACQQTYNLGNVYGSFLFFSFAACCVQPQTAHLVHVSSYGENDANCLSTSTGEPPCKTLDYVLNEGTAMFQNKSILVEVSYSHAINAVRASLQGVVSMTINGTDSVTITCSSSVVALSNGQSLQIEHIAFRGCYGKDYYSYGKDYYSYGVVLDNSIHVQLTHTVFSSTGGVVLSNVTTVLLKECHFRENIIVSNSCALSNPVSPLLVTEMTMTTQLTILDSTFMGNWIRVSNFSQTNTAVGGLVINLSYQAHLPLNIILENNNFINNTAMSSIGVGALQLTAFSNPSNMSHVMVWLTKNTFLQNKVIGSYTGSGSVEFYIQRCNDLTVRSRSNEYTLNVGEENVPAALGVYFQPKDCLVSSSVDMKFFNDKFIGNVGFQTGGAVDIYFSSSGPTGYCKTNVFVAHLHFFNCSFYNNTASYGPAMHIASEYPNSHCYGENHLSLILENCTFSMNRIISEVSGPLSQTTSSLYSAIVYVVQGCVEIVDSTFFDNKGTALVLDNVLANFSGMVMIDNNTGVNGGGIRWDTSFSVDIKPGTQMYITNNNAVSGGAIYFDYMQGKCHLTCNGGESSLAQCGAEIVILNNTASSDGHTTFMINPLPIIGDTGTSCIKNHTEILQILVLPDPPNGPKQLSSSAQYITPSTDDSPTLNVFPGALLLINASPSDWWKQNTSCSAVVYLTCMCGETELSYCGHGQPVISGPPQQLLDSDTITAELTIKSEEGPLPNTFTLVLHCTYAAT